MTRDIAKGAPPVPMLSVGYLISNDKDAIRLAMTGEFDENGKVSDVLVIPRQNITKIKKI
jgi:hypothetical protein